MRWIFSFLYEYAKMPKDDSADNQAKHNTKTMVLLVALFLSLSLSLWLGERLWKVSAAQVKVLARVKALEAAAQLQQSCPTLLAETKGYLKQCLESRYK